MTSSHQLLVVALAVVQAVVVVEVPPVVEVGVVGVHRVVAVVVPLQRPLVVVCLRS